MVEERESSARGEIVDIFSAVNIFIGEWVVIRVTEKDKKGIPEKGELLTHGDEEKILEFVNTKFRFMSEGEYALCTLYGIEIQDGVPVTGYPLIETFVKSR